MGDIKREMGGLVNVKNKEQSFIDTIESLCRGILEMDETHYNKVMAQLSEDNDPITKQICLLLDSERKA